MSWDAEPPKKDELQVAKIGSWDDDPPEQEKVSTQGEAALQGFGNGLSLGYLPHLQAMAEKPLARIYDALMSTNVSEDIDDDYVKRRDDWIKRQTKLAGDNPGTYGTANVAGNVVSGLALPGGAAAKGASAGAKVGLSALYGGAVGGLTNPGDKEGEYNPTQFVDRAKNSAIGTAVGGGLAIAAQGVSKYAPDALDFAQRKLTEAADDRSASALGMTKALRKKLGDVKVREVGRSGLDNEVVTPLANTKKMLERAGELSDSSGDVIGQTMEELDKQGIKAFNPLDVGTRVDSEIGNVYRHEPLFKGLSNQYENTLETILNRGDQPISFADAQKLKEVLQQYGYKEGAAAPGREIAQKVGGVVREELENSVEQGAQKLSNAEMAQKYLAAKKNYGASQHMKTALENKLAAEQGNQGGVIGGLFGLRNAGAKAMGAASGAGLPGVVAGDVAATGVRAFGNQTSAVAMDKAAKFLMKIPRFQQLADTNPRAFKAAVASISQKLETSSALPRAASNELDGDTSRSSNEHVEPEEAQRRFLEGN